MIKHGMKRKLDSWLMAGREGTLFQAPSPFSPSYFRARVCELFAQADLQP
jgi:hypothetical protein